jgi:hypothetical protein
MTFGPSTTRKITSGERSIGSKVGAYELAVAWVHSFLQSATLGRPALELQVDLFLYRVPLEHKVMGSSP